MSTVQRVAQIFGIVFILVAILGFFTPGGMAMEADPATAGQVLGLFPVNLLHNVVHLAFGAWGVLAARSFDGAKSFATIGGAIYLVLTILGFLSPSGFGFVPLGGNDIWLHLLLAVALLYFGVTAKRTETTAAV